MFIGILLVVLGVIFGLYIGVWILFVGGVVQISESMQSNPMQSYGIAMGFLKIIFASFVGLICGFMGIIPGFYMIEKSISN
jgi:hypothetical protein